MEINTVASYFALRSTPLYNWTFLLSDNVLLTLPPAEFDIWIELRRRFVGVDAKALRTWIHPVDFEDVDPFNGPIQTHVYLNWYHKNTQINQWISADDQLRRLCALSKAANEQALTVR